MAKFVAKPFYEVCDVVALWNAYEEQAAKGAPAGYKRRVWNRWSVRRLLQKKGLLQRQPGAQGTKRTVTLAELRAAWPELIDSMVLVDAIDDARAA